MAETDCRSVCCQDGGPHLTHAGVGGVWSALLIGLSLLSVPGIVLEVLE